MGTDWIVAGNQHHQSVYVGTVHRDLCHCIWPYDRDLFNREPCTDPVFHNGKPGMGTNGNWVSAFPFCPGFSGFFDPELDVRVRPIAPMGNLLAFANVTIGGCFKIDGFRICSSEKGLYVNMPATQDKGGNWKDVCWPVTAEFRKQLNDALIDGYGQAIENLQATLEATKGAAEKPSLTGALKENAGKVKEQPTKPAPSKNEQAR